MLADQVDGDPGERFSEALEVRLLVIRAAGDDHVGKLLGRNAEFLKGWLDVLNILMENLKTETVLDWTQDNHKPGPCLYRARQHPSTLSWPVCCPHQCR